MPRQSTIIAALKEFRWYFSKAARFSQLEVSFMAMKQKNLPAIVPELFEHEDFGKIRGFEVEGEPWFVGIDVARALGYKESAKAIREHVPDKFKGVSVLDTPGGKQKVVIINEAGLYRLAFSSKLPSAVTFTDWVCEKVLPSIRKYGYYSVAAEKKMVIYSGKPAPELLEPMTEEEFFDVIGKLAEAERIEILQS